jgi:hypothetical protein
MVVLSLKDTVENDKISLSKPVKADLKRNISVSYEGKPMMIKTPRVRLNKEDGSLSFNLKNKASFVKFLESLEDSFCDILVSQSSTLFGGRVFSCDKMRSSLNRCWDITEEGSVILKTSCNISDIKCTDMFGDKVLFDNIQNHVSAVLHLRNIVFVKNLWEFDFVISHLKMSKFEETCNSNPFEEKQIVETNICVNPTLEDDTADFFLD